MYKKSIIAAAALVLFSLQTAFGQGEGRFVTVGDTSINLADVDLEKGLVIEKKQFSIDTGVHRPSRYIVKVKVYSGTAYDNYAIVRDTIRFLNGSRHGYHCLAIEYFDSNNEMLFEKHFKYLQVFRLYISSTGEAVLIELISEDAHDVLLFNGKGQLIKTYGNQYERLYVGLKHGYFFICNHNNSPGPNSYDRIDKSGSIEEIVFPSGFLRGIKFSPKENFYLVLLDKDQLLYDINNNLIWKIEDYTSAINISSDEKQYLTRNFSNGSIEVKDLLNHEIIYSIDIITNRIVDARARCIKSNVIMSNRSCPIAQ